VSVWDVILLLLRDVLWSGVASLGFAILFNVPRRVLFACAIGGAIGHIIRTLLMEWGVGMEAATLMGSTVVGFLGEVGARRWHAPAPVFTVPALIPMVPGTLAYRAMMGLLTLASAGTAAGAALLLETAVNASKALLIVVALAMGTAAPKMLIRLGGRRESRR
jgi:uncharacterized membrane protein YjjB (DUF3815 family)